MLRILVAIFLSGSVFGGTLWNSLPLSNAIKESKGNPQHKIAIFSDPDCPFCRKYEGEVLPLLNNIEIYIFPIPFEILHPGSVAKTLSVICLPQEERFNAWVKVSVLREKLPQMNCDAGEKQLKEIYDYARYTLRIRATPTIVFENDTVVAGAIDLAKTLEIMENP